MMTFSEQRDFLIQFIIMTSLSIQGFALHEIVAVINDSVTLSCTPKSLVGIQWQFNSPYNTIYGGGQFRGSWKERYSTESNNTMGTYNIVISNVKLEDAGHYHCSEEKSGIQISSTQLTVLESNPVCSSNMNHDGFIGPNTCSIQQEDMTFHCALSFNGIPPQITWKSTIDDETRNSSLCEDQPNRRNCSLTLKSDPSFHRTAFTCQIATSSGRQTQFNCSTKKINVQYFLAEKTESSLAQNVHVSCDVESSLSVDYKWTVKKDGWCSFLGSMRTILIEDVGLHQCEVTYVIRNVPCNFLVVTLDDENLFHTYVIIYLSTSASYSLIIILYGLHLWASRRIIVYLERPNLIHTIQTEASKTEDKLIKGIAILNNELYIISQQESKIEVYDSKSLEHLRAFTVEELTNPEDACSCINNKCLYISENKPESKEILRVDPDGKLITKWQIGEEFGRLSVSFEATVVVVVHDNSILMEYASDGILIRTIELSLLEIQHPMHAVKLKSGNFLVAHGYLQDSKHRLCEINTGSNKISKVYRGDNGNESSELNNPWCLAIDREGSIMVADAIGGCVLLLGSNYGFKREIIPKEYRLTMPTRILLDELNGKLHVVDLKSKERALYAFQIIEVFEFENLYQRIRHYFRDSNRVS